MSKPLYALINPITNKIVQFSELFNSEHKIVFSTTYVDGQRIENYVVAYCILVDWNSSLINKTFNPNNQTFI